MNYRITATILEWRSLLLSCFFFHFVDLLINILCYETNCGLLIALVHKNNLILVLHFFAFQIQSVLEETLQATGAKAMVVGHTPQSAGVNWYGPFI